MPSSVDEQPPSRPSRPRSQPPRRRPAGRAGATASRRAPAPARRARPPAPPSRRPPVDDDGRDDGDFSPEPRSQTRIVVLLSVLTVAVVGLAIFGFALANRSDPGPAPAPDNVLVPVSTFRDAETGATVQYPRSWRRVQVPNATYRLVLDGGNNVAMTLRVFTTEVPTTPANLENIKAVTDGVVTSNATVQILKQQ